MIAPLGPGDERASIELWHACELTRPWNDPEADYRRALAGPSSTVLGAFADRRLVGTSMVGDDGHRGWIYYFAIAEAHRRRGLGTELFAASKRWLRTRGVVKLNLMIRDDNVDARHFYEKLGLRPDAVSVLAVRLD